MFGGYHDVYNHKSPCVVSHTMPLSLAASSALFKVVVYRSTLLGDEIASITVGGRCFAGDTQMPCRALDLGANVL